MKFHLHYGLISKVTLTYFDIIALEILYQHFEGAILEDGELNNRIDSGPLVQLLGAVASKPSVPILRKDFPETWIWNEVNEEG